MPCTEMACVNDLARYTFQLPLYIDCAGSFWDSCLASDHISSNEKGRRAVHNMHTYTAMIDGSNLSFHTVYVYTATVCVHIAW